MALLSESLTEKMALGWFREMDYLVIGGADMPPGVNSLRETYKDVLFPTTLHGALIRLNPELPPEAIDDAERKLLNPEGQMLEARNRAFHRMAIDGVAVEYRRADGEIQGGQVQVFDFVNPDNNDWIVVNQFTVIEGNQRCRPDAVIFINGLPLAVVEIKSPLDENATIFSAWRQLQTYKKEIPSLFVFNLALVISDGFKARIGSLTSRLERFKPWRTIKGEGLAPKFYSELQVLIEGVFEKNRFLELLRSFVVFEAIGGGLMKKMAGYHQFHAVRVAVSETLRATQMQREGIPLKQNDLKVVTHKTGGDPGDQRIGIVWHTQGSGKSLTMAFYAGCIIREPAMKNPTIIILTDRNDIDNQLFATFSRCKGLLGQPPVQAMNRKDLREKLSVSGGGVIFTTIQKFFPDKKGNEHPLLSERRNIVVIADEAHRSQYDFINGYARHMRDALPCASFIGFTGTPIEFSDANTRAVFGDHISIYDTCRSVDDGATVPIFYENRLAHLRLDDSERPHIDSDFEEVTETEEINCSEKLKSKWTQLEAIVGSGKRITRIAEDIISHFEKRLEVIEGKAMVVCMSRRICIDLYQNLIKLRPEWHCEEDNAGVMKIVMTGSASDPLEWQPHIRSKSQREELAKRFRDPDDLFQIVIVRDMWLTGFDAPSLHTMYVDKPMRGHGLMQAIAGVNRAFGDKPGGLVVDYLGFADDLKWARMTYTQSGGQGEATLEKEQAIRIMQEKHEICSGLFYGFDRTRISSSNYMDWLPYAMEHILMKKKGKERCVKAVRDLRKAFALSVPHEKADSIREDVAFFQAVQVALSIRVASEGKAIEEPNQAMRQIISRAVIPEGITDVFASAGLKKPDISILSESFLREVRNLKKPNLAVELLRKLLKGEITTRRKKNIIQSKSFAEMLEQTILRYQNRAVDTIQIIEELIQLAREMREANARGTDLGLTEDELAFYDALETNDTAVQVLGDEKFCEIARKLTQTVKDNVKIDWAFREDVRVNLRRLIMRNLKGYGYPPDKQEKATRKVIEQAEVLSDDWVTAP